MREEPVSEPSAALPEPAASPAPPAPRRRVWWVAAAAGVAGLVVGAGAVGLAWGLSGSGEAKAPGASKPVETFTMEGNVKLVLSLREAMQKLNQGGQCMPRHSGPYADIQEGATVTVYSADGTVLSTGELQEGVPSATDCTFPFAATGVPEGEKFYQVEVEHSGKKPVPTKKAHEGDVVVEFKLG
ncbi:hypothetical protein ACIP4X_14020 [Streptomyces sp. NPDC088817]|uniref:hypothetical protein n=1 Tax=Streptomyces sp. NPDC088817 TaxID=3365907 RepID=UPI0038165E2E